MRVLILAFVLAFCSFSYEVLLAFVASQMTGLSVLSKSITFGSFILGLGLGGWRAEKKLGPTLAKSPATSNLMSLLFSVQWRLTFLTTVGVVLALLWHGFLLGASWRGANLWAMFSMQPLSLGVGYLSGFELPLLIAWGKAYKLKENQVLVPHYMGVLLASVVALSFLVPRFDMMGSIFGVASLNFGVALVLMLCCCQAQGWCKALRLVVCLCALALCFYIEPQLYKLYAQQLHHKVSFRATSFQGLRQSLNLLQNMPEVERTRSLYQYIDVLPSLPLSPQHQQHVKKTFKDANFEVPVIYSLFLNRQSQFSSILEHTYHQQITHVPIEYFNFVPQRALVLGAGDGLLVRELLKYKKMQIDLVELDGQVLQLAQNEARFLWQNKGSLLSSRVQVHVGDAILFLRQKIKQLKRAQGGAQGAGPVPLYDAVFIDFPYPENYEVSKLYSLEFYKLVARVLNPQGFIVLDAPLSLGDDGQGRVEEGGVDRRALLSNRQNSILLSTLHYAGFEHMLPYGIRGGFIAAKWQKAQRLVQKKITSPHVSDFLKNNLRFRGDVLNYTRKGKKFINSMFKPQPIGLSHRLMWVH